MIQDYLQRAQRAQDQLQKPEFKQYHHQQSLPTSSHDQQQQQNLMGKLSFLQAENEKLQELLVIERNSKEKYRNMAELKSQIFGRTFYEVEIQELNDQNTVLQRNLDLLQTFFFNTSEQISTQNTTKYEKQMEVLRSDLKESCQYNMILMGELEKPIVEQQQHQQLEKKEQPTHDVTVSSMKNKIDELETQVTFLKESITAMRVDEQAQMADSNPYTQKQVLNLEKTLKQANEETARLIKQLKDKDETIVQLMTMERRLMTQAQEPALLKQNSMISNKALLSKKSTIRTPNDQHEVNKKFDQMMKRNDDSRSQNSEKSETSNIINTNINNNKFVTVLQEQLADKDRYIAYLKNESSDSQMIQQLDQLESDVKHLNAQLSDKTTQLMKAQVDLKALSDRLCDVEELGALRLALQRTLQDLTTEQNKVMHLTKDYEGKLRTQEEQIKSQYTSILAQLENQVHEKDEEILDLTQKVDHLNHKEIHVVFMEEELSALKEEMAALKVAKDDDSWTKVESPPPILLFEMAQKSLLPQLLPKRITNLSASQSVEYKHIELVAEDASTHMPVSLQLRARSFSMTMQDLFVNSSDITHMDFDYKVGVLAIHYRDKSIRMSGLDVANLYATLAHRFKLMDGLSIEVGGK